MSVKKLKAYKKTIIEKIETHLPELCNDIDEVIAIKEKNSSNVNSIIIISTTLGIVFLIIFILIFLNK